MSGRVKSRQGGSSVALEQATLSINERILKECHTLYTDSDKGVYCVELSNEKKERRLSL